MEGRVRAAGLDTTSAASAASVTSSKNADLIAIRMTSELATSPFHIKTHIFHIKTQRNHINQGPAGMSVAKPVFLRKIKPLRAWQKDIQTCWRKMKPLREWQHQIWTGGHNILDFWGWQSITFGDDIKIGNFKSMSIFWEWF